MKWSIALVVLVSLLLIEAADERRAAAKAGKGGCRYRKGTWSPCDDTTKSRTRTLTLKAGDKATCEPTKTLTKQCNKACRYEKGNWGPCDAAKSEMVRMDHLKSSSSGSDSSCAPTRQVTRSCNPDGAGRRKNKGENSGKGDRSGTRRNKNRNNQQ